MNRLYFLALIILLFSCAEIVPPTGGERDMEAPKIVSLYPQNGALLFVENKIEIKFDEFFKIKTSGDNIFISPSLNEKPKYQVVGKKLFITFQEKLIENTTYNINFGEAIEDYNEGNKLEGFNYIFSTGSFIDSLEITGQILDAFDKKPIENVMVLLYSEQEDSVLYKKPLYMSKTDASGNYTIKNIKAGKYRIAALEDKNQNYIFDQSTERIAFVEEVIEVNENLKAEPFYLFENIENIAIIKKNTEEDNHIFFEFNKAFSKISLDISDYNKKDIVYYSDDKKNLHYWYLNKKESSNIYFIIDNNTKDTLSIYLKGDTSNTPFDIKIDTDIQDESNVILLDFPFPISSFNKESLILKDSKGSFISFNSKWDKHKLNLSLETNKALDTVNINIKEASFTSFHNKINTKIEKTLHNFSILSTNLSLDIPFTEQNIVLQLINSENKVVNQQNVSRETKVQFNNIKTGKYFIRIFIDKNENGLWDSGLFHVKQYPEKTLFYSKEINIEANWDKELEIKF